MTGLVSIYMCVYIYVSAYSTICVYMRAHTAIYVVSRADDEVSVSGSGRLCISAYCCVCVSFSLYICVRILVCMCVCVAHIRMLTYAIRLLLLCDALRMLSDVSRICVFSYYFIL
jgi:hypothetical protein